jgi:hypothetical protein
MNSTSFELRPPAFLADVAREVAAYFVQHGKPVRNRVRSHLAQFWWGNDSTVHYEIAMHERTGRIELGLHLESSPTRNRSLYAGFDRYLLEIQNALGDGMWLEDWDKGWVRLYETHPLAPLDEARVYAMAGRFCEIMECLQPIYETL